MLFPKQILDKCSGLKIQEKRQVDDDYVEVVFYTEDTEKWKKILTEALGPEVKPEEVNDRENLAFTEDYGGMNENQTLFKKEEGDTAVVAMLWPWSNGDLITLKLILFKR